MTRIAESSKLQPRGRPFPKGTSGNPGGRAKRTQEALEVIENLMANSTNDRVRLAAAQYILDRAWGKPTQRQELEPIQLEVYAADRRPEEVYLEMLQARRRLVQ